MSTTDDDASKILSVDEKAVTVRELKEMVFGFSHLATLADKGELPTAVTRAVLSSCEFRLAALAKLAGIEIQTQADMDERYSRIRAANDRIRELERQLGDTAQATTVQMGLKSLSAKLNYWWDVYGFGYISEIRFTDYGHAEVTFSCSLSGSWPILMSRTPVSDKQSKKDWIQGLTGKGYVLTSEDREAALLDCEATRETLENLFSTHLPSARILETSNHSGNDRQMVLRSVKVFIRNLQEVQDLAEPPAPAAR